MDRRSIAIYAIACVGVFREFLGRLAVSAALVAVSIAAPAYAEEVPVDLELVLAVDVSGSVDSVEAAQQREGYLAALTHPGVMAAIQGGRIGRIAVVYVEWAGAEYQRVIADWQMIDGPDTARALADRIGSQPITTAYWTSIANAIDFSVGLFANNGFAGERQAIDISGDGVNNRGGLVQEARDRAVAAGFTINGLPILNDRPQPYGGPTPLQVNLDQYYIENVIGGPDAFIEIAEGFEAFPAAILRKLIKEIAGYSPERGFPATTADLARQTHDSAQAQGQSARVSAHAIASDEIR